jgi:hypothetical protein
MRDFILFGFMASSATRSFGSGRGLMLGVLNEGDPHACYMWISAWTEFVAWGFLFHSPRDNE